MHWRKHTENSTVFIHCIEMYPPAVHTVFDVKSMTLTPANTDLIKRRTG